MDEKPTADPQRESIGDIVIPKKVVLAGVGVILILFLTFSGLLSRGYESKTIRFANISKSSHGSAFGTKRMFLRQGQTLAIDYDAEVEKGSLYLRLRSFWAPHNAPPLDEVRVSQSGSGQLHIPIPSTGVYQLWISGTPDRDGYDLSYTVSWKAE
jgi:hypothetical protein